MTVSRGRELSIIPHEKKLCECLRNMHIFVKHTHLKTMVLMSQISISNNQNQCFSLKQIWLASQRIRKMMLGHGKYHAFVLTAKSQGDDI